MHPLALARLLRVGHRPKDYPPGPPTLPILGNIHQVCKLQSLREISCGTQRNMTSVRSQQMIPIYSSRNGQGMTTQETFMDEKVVFPGENGKIPISEAEIGVSARGRRAQRIARGLCQRGRSGSGIAVCAEVVREHCCSWFEEIANEEICLCDDRERHQRYLQQSPSNKTVENNRDALTCRKNGVRTRGVV